MLIVSCPCLAVAYSAGGEVTPQALNQTAVHKTWQQAMLSAKMSVLQALAGVRKQEAALKAEREGVAERLRTAEADSTARVRQAVEVVEDLKVHA
jgi:predicted transcriptional regulator